MSTVLMDAARFRPPDNKKPPSAQTEAAFKTTSQSDHNASVKAAQCGKAVAVWLYSIGAVNLGATQAKFRRHPEWVHA